jgi:hypothetical protein
MPSSWWRLESPREGALLFEPLVPNDETIEVIKAARRDELTTVGPSSKPLAGLNSDQLDTLRLQARFQGEKFGRHSKCLDAGRSRAPISTRLMVNQVFAGKPILFSPSLKSGRLGDWDPKKCPTVGRAVPPRRNCNSKGTKYAAFSPPPHVMAAINQTSH